MAGSYYRSNPHKIINIISIINSRRTYVLVKICPHAAYRLVSCYSTVRSKGLRRISKARSANKEENSHRLQCPYIQNARIISNRKSRYRRYEGQRPKNGQHTGCPWAIVCILVPYFGVRELRMLIDTASGAHRSCLGGSRERGDKKRETRISGILYAMKRRPGNWCQLHTGCLDLSLVWAGKRNSSNWRMRP